MSNDEISTQQTGPSALEILADPLASAKLAGLRYVSDERPGIGREKAGATTRYTKPDGTIIRDEAVLERIRALGIPPAWTSVWICVDARGHLQATGRDAKGRKQYRYHTKWRAVRDENKYEKLLEFGAALPALRERIDHDLKLPGLPREKVLAAVVRLLETTLIRVGNTEYARKNHSFGLTTLNRRHVKIVGETLSFQFRGKSGVEHKVGLRDRRLARIVRQCQELPGHELFHYVDEQGDRHAIDSSDVNGYLQSVTGQEFTAKDFRTWSGTVLAALTLRELAAFTSATEAKRNVVEAIKRVSRRLGNTPAICRKCYVHPTVVDAYLEGTMLAALEACAAGDCAEGLPPDEAMVMAFLRERIANSAMRFAAAGPTRVRSNKNAGRRGIAEHAQAARRPTSKRIRRARA